MSAVQQCTSRSAAPSPSRCRFACTCREVPWAWSSVPGPCVFLWSGGAVRERVGVSSGSLLCLVDPKVGSRARGSVCRLGVGVVQVCLRGVVSGGVSGSVCCGVRWTTNQTSNLAPQERREQTAAGASKDRQASTHTGPPGPLESSGASGSCGHKRAHLHTPLRGRAGVVGLAPTGLVPRCCSHATRISHLCVRWVAAHGT